VLSTAQIGAIGFMILTVFQAFYFVENGLASALRNTLIREKLHLERS